MIANATSATPPDAAKSLGDQLALDRTRLAHERTMMAWIRTSASMITFGFGIYKFFDYLGPDHPIRQGVVAPRRFAIFLIYTGIVVLAGAVVQNWLDPHRLLQHGHVSISLAGGIAALISILGFFALSAAILRD